jgi:geranylgeranyl pyrophosphate synthase
VRRFCRCLGAAYQVKNDLRDWEADEHDKVVSGQDALSHRPTILHAFAVAANPDAAVAELAGEATSPQERVESLREVYEGEKAFEKAGRLLDRYREAALQETERVDSNALSQLMRLITEIVL